MEILLIRHAKTNGNLLRRYIGSTDEPLCEEGIAACKSAGIFSDISKVYVTSLIRTQQTANFLFPNAETVVVPGLEEMDFGAFENRSANEMDGDADYQSWVDSFCENACPNGEKKDDFVRRICSTFETLLSRAFEANEKRLILVVHGGTIMSLGSRFGVPERSYYEWGISNLQGYRFSVEQDDKEQLVFSGWDSFQSLPL